MKFMLLVVILTSMLFSAQKQIILGCFSHENNAINDTARLEGYMQSDSSLKKLMQKNSLKVELKKVGDYHVVTLSAFDSYPQLCLTLSKLEKYYNDAYVLEYPLESQTIEKKFTIAEQKDPKKIEKVAQEVIKEAPVKEIKEPVVVEVVPTKEIKEPVVTEVVPTKEIKEHLFIPQEIIEKPIEVEPEPKLSDYYLEIGLGLLALLILIGTGFVIYKNSALEKQTTDDA